MALALVIWWTWLRGGGDEAKEPLQRNSIEPNEMKESMIEEVDDTEHLYLEQ